MAKGEMVKKEIPFFDSQTPRLFFALLPFRPFSVLGQAEPAESFYRAGICSLNHALVCLTTCSNPSPR